ncbi:hypothetical protein [Shewanella youngdeokensis]|uniref:Uncharacterized protein n=1 Tax=Shewanella youngdeokensis TaxID=2999068 RepID=A0ABZ0JUT1_9GAMM|nr:hypothetical protein RGE70_09590 [Shewanella sp. DAU334]
MKDNIWRRLYIFTPLHHKTDEEINTMFAGQFKGKELPFIRKANMALLMPAQKINYMGSYLVIGNDSPSICKAPQIIAKRLKNSGFTGKRAKVVSEIIDSSGYELAFGSFSELMSQTIFYLNGEPIPQRESEDSPVCLNSLVFSYATWKDITRELHPGFGCWSTPKRHRYILNTIRHELGLYDKLSKVSNGASVALFCDRITKTMPLLSSAVAELKQKKINNNVNVYQDIKARNFTKKEEEQLSKFTKYSNNLSDNLYE